MNNLSIIILTRNEEVHIKRCLESVKGFCKDVFIVDSNSTDKTMDIAKKYTANISTGDFNTFSEKLNWAIENLPIKTTWSMRLDADEILTDGFKKEIHSSLGGLSNKINGVYLRRQLWFMNRWMRYGGMYPIYSMRIWRTKEAFCEDRALDEHMLLKRGESIKFNLDIIDNPLSLINKWVDKHNEYSDLEVISYFDNDKSKIIWLKLFDNQEARKRWLKNIFYRKIPLFIRPFMYFFYRYIFCLGFLDGKKGFIWHVLHAFYYRFLIDVKIYETIEKSTKSQETIKKKHKNET
jgi:glycosyltransferase involved in cell wall biosynthesis